MQIVSDENNLYEMSNLFSGKKKEKYHQFVVCWISTESNKGYMKLTAWS